MSVKIPLSSPSGHATVAIPGPWLDARAAASHAHVSAATILREARAGRLRAYEIGGRKIWRFRASDIDAWIEAGGPQPYGAEGRA